MNTLMRRLGWLTLLGGALGISISGCSTEAYCFVCEPGDFGGAGEKSTSNIGNSAVTTTGGLNFGGSRGMGGSGGESGAGVGGEGGCSADTENDPGNCGACGVICQANGAIPQCVDGKCTWTDCRIGRHDNNENPADGCEYECNFSNDQIEICDGLDNDCDGTVDNDFDLTTINDCGRCGNECFVPNATPTCNEVADGIYNCGYSECDENWYDFDGLLDNGCEKQCIESNLGVEICDGRDNNCNGQIDEEAPNVGLPCTDAALCPWHPTGECVGQCADRGVYVCSGNQLICVPKPGAPTPTLEVCDVEMVDEDCDGMQNEGFNLNADIFNCGSCGNVCVVENAFPACVNGECEVGTCRTGYNDVDPDVPGCEYECPEAVNDEKCDGIDNDCDGQIDEVDDLVAPTTPCLQTGPCSGAQWVCGNNPMTNELEWYCDYQAIDSRIEVDPTTIWPGPEQACDAFDNNCDGNLDEGMGLYQFCANSGQCGASCNQGRCTCSNDSQCDFGFACNAGLCTAQCFAGVGECANTAFVQCAGDGQGTSCTANPITGNAGNEICDGLDNNCDGQVDETTPAAGNAFAGVADEVVFIDVPASSNDFYIYQYEASRPDSILDDAGVSDARSCSKASVMPWTSVTQAEAAAACAAAGMQLCTQTQWELACRAGVNGKVWSYPSNRTTYQAGACNDVEHPANATTPAAWATGSGAGCYTPSAQGDIFDLSGNVSEWTSTPFVSASNDTYYRVRGGNYTSYGAATACGFSFVLDVPTFANADLGFRCCGANPPNVQ